MYFGAPLLLTALLSGCIQVSVSQGVTCYESFDDNTGRCLDFIGEDVSVEDCCLNIMYSFKRDTDSPCEPCYPAEWSPWSPWGPCSVSCREGVQQRRRACYGQGECTGNPDKLESRLETRSCSQQDCCPEDGGWSDWSPWSACSVTCATGTMERRRECNNPAPQCGGTCPGPDKEISSCNTFQICPTHGAWSNWGPWGECSHHCVNEGSGILPTQVRHRQCNNPAPSAVPPGNFCPGLAQETRDCSGLPFCPEDGQWGDWHKESECSVTCGLGRETEKRSCDSPAPRHGGRDCVGTNTRFIMCNARVPCPINGQWSEWSAWDECAPRAGGSPIKCKQLTGQQLRKRSCERRDFGGLPCKGKTSDFQACYYAKRCGYDGTWSEWSEWGLCLPPCGESTRTRIKKCEPIYPPYKNVTGITKDTPVFFWGDPNSLCSPINKQRVKVEESEPCQNVVECGELDD